MPDPREWENWDSDNAAQAIDEYWRTSPVEATWRQILMADMQQVFEGPCQILEVGCGSGVIYEAMLDRGLITPEMYTGGDISEKLLAIAKVRYPVTTFRSLDVYNLPYPDHSQDNVVCVSVLQHLPDYKAAVMELLRVTRKHLYLALWMHEGPEDTIAFDGEFYENSYSLPLFNKLVAEKCRIRHLYLSNYSAVFDLCTPRSLPSVDSEAVVYTAIFGAYDELKDPSVSNPKVPYVCLTERPQSSCTWQPRIELRKQATPVLDARRCKILAHEAFPNAKYSAWVDGSIKLLKDPGELWREYLRDTDIAVLRWNPTTLREAAAVIVRLKRAPEEVVKQQLQRYIEEGLPESTQTPATGLVLRRHTKAVQRFNEAWWQEIQQESTRDQLSFVYVAWKLGIPYTVLPQLPPWEGLVSWKPHVGLGWDTDLGTYYQARLGLLYSALPELWSLGGTCLYVGASPERTQLVDELAQVGYKITLLEAWAPNYEVLKSDRRFVRALHGDVRALQSRGDLDVYDVAVWWHGPEHVEREELPATLKALEQRAKGLVLLGCPWGRNDQGPVGGNTFEVHRSHLDLEDFTALGYEATGVGAKGLPRSHIVAWKRLDP